MGVGPHQALNVEQSSTDQGTKGCTQDMQVACVSKHQERKSGSTVAGKTSGR